MNRYRSIRQGSPLALSLLLAVSAGQAGAAENNFNPQQSGLAGASLKPAPGAGYDHTLRVKLDGKGDWTVLADEDVPLRMSYSLQWAKPPSKLTKSNIWFGAPAGASTPGEAGVAYSPAQTVQLEQAQVLAGGGNVTARVALPLLLNSGGPDSAEEICAAERAKRLQQGKSLNQVLRFGFSVPAKTQATLYNVHQKSGDYYVTKLQTTVPLQIQCQGNPAIADKIAPPKGPGGVLAPFAINSVSLTALPAQITAVCPAAAMLKAEIQGVGSGPVKFSIDDLDDAAPPQQRFSNLPGQPGEANVRVLMEKITIAPRPEDKAFSPDKLQQPGKIPPLKRRYRLQVLEPNAIASAPVEVEVNCTATLKGGQAAQPGQLAAPPQAPQLPGNVRAPNDPDPGPQLKLQAQQMLPDFEVVQAQQNRSPKRVDVLVRNKGSAASKGGQVFGLYMGTPKQQASATLSPLAPGQQRWFSLNFAQPIEAGELELRVDPNNQVKELNEDNNVFKLTP